MRRVFGPRTVVEAAFLVSVPVVAAAIGSGTSSIIAASGAGYLVVLVLEATLLREGRAAPAALSRLRLPSRNVVVKRPEPEPVAPAPVESVLVHQPPAPAPVPAQPEHVRVLRPEPEPVPPPAPRPAPVPAIEFAPLVAVPEPVAEPVAVHEPEPVPAAPPTVVPIGYGAGPRQWSLWDLERLTRESAGVDAVRDEERQFLLMYLREFADANGMLPIDFDGLVRDSFGELLGV